MTAAARHTVVPLIPGAAIRGFRHRHRLSQRELGEMVGVSGVMIHYLETGVKRTPNRIAVELAGLFDAPVADLSRPVVETLDEQTLLLAFRHLPEDERAALLALVRS